jgi:alcohol dehydrogenase (cytochrome c)
MKEPTRALVLVTGALCAAWVGCQHVAGGEAGLFTVAQSARGQALYAGRCAGCHGANLVGGTAPPLTGPLFAASWGPESLFAQALGRTFTVDDLAFFTSTMMPPGNAKSISPQDHAAILAFLLEQNGYRPGATELALGDARSKQTALRPSAAVKQAAAPPPEFLTGPGWGRTRSAGPTAQELRDAARSTRDWLYHTHDYSGARYVALDQINAKNAARLAVVCALQVGEVTTFQSGPIVYQSVMYVTTASSTIALDAESCRVKWRHTWDPKGPVGWPNNRGVALADGLAVRGTSDGYLIALDAENGELVWARRVADATLGETITMPPLIYGDRILIGPAGSENAISGWVGAFALADGNPLWKFSTVPGAGQHGSESWRNAADVKVGGGAVWTPLSVDPATSELFIAVTNPAPDLPAELRPGDNLYTNSLVALDVATGALRWYAQTVPNDSHDWDLTQVSPLFSLSIGGKAKRLVATAGKDGMLRTLDRDSHAVVYATAVTTIANADAPVTTTGTHACPGTLGGVEWNGPAYNPGTRMLYVGAVDWCATSWAAETLRHIPGRLYMGGAYQMDASAQGWITALDAATGATRWRYRSSEPVVGAITTTKGNIVLAGEVTGDFVALDAKTGRVLYRFNTGGGIGGGIVTYALGGVQYVAVASGRAGVQFLRGNPGTPTVFVFALK